MKTLSNGDKVAVLSWFERKALAKANAALKLIDESVEQGFWVPGASRKVRAALNKSKRATKLAIEIEPILSGLGKPAGYGLSAGWNVTHYIRFGHFEQIQTIDFKALSAEVTDCTDLTIQRARRDALMRAAIYADAFKPVAALLAQLDIRRPKPQFTYLGVSPTVTKVLEDAGFEPQTYKAEICPGHFEERELKDDKGKVIKVYSVYVLDWPEGTIHGKSRYHRYDDQCEACGHGIRNMNNWLPVIMRDVSGQPYALITGIDCGRTLFGIKVTGELRLAEKKVVPYEG